MTKTYIDIDSHTYLSTEDHQTWRLYRMHGTWALCAIFSGTEAEARERAGYPIPWTDRREMREAFERKYQAIAAEG